MLIGTLDSTKNFVEVQASMGYGSSDTSIVLQAGQGAKLPSTPFNLVWWNSTDYSNPANDPNVEIVRVTNVSTDTLTITRAQESTSASTKNTASKTYSLVLSPTSKMISDIGNVGIKAQALTGTIDGSNTSFTFATGKNGTNNTIIVLGGQVFAFEGVDYTISGTTVSYTTAPPAGYSGQPHKLICLG